mmetsp:Transcript_146656/g.381190  ORF Transcript_146656/g.381190 Transcript_146656/m.381190 type:complete len:307 (+) Transcript_146656:1232-2152(+)
MLWQSSAWPEASDASLALGSEKLSSVSSPPSIDISPSWTSELAPSTRGRLTKPKSTVPARSSAVSFGDSAHARRLPSTLAKSINSALSKASALLPAAAAATVDEATLLALRTPLTVDAELVSVPALIDPSADSDAEANDPAERSEGSKTEIPRAARTTPVSCSALDGDKAPPAARPTFKAPCTAAVATAAGVEAPIIAAREATASTRARTAAGSWSSAQAGTAPMMARTASASPENTVSLRTSANSNSCVLVRLHPPSPHASKMPASSAAMVLVVIVVVTVTVAVAVAVVAAELREVCLDDLQVLA